MELIISKEQSTKQTTQAKKDVDVGTSEQVAVTKQDQAGTARSKEKTKRRTRSKYVLLVKEQSEDNKKIEDKQKSLSKNGSQPEGPIWSKTITQRVPKRALLVQNA